MLNSHRNERRKGGSERGRKETGKWVTFSPAAGPFPGPEGGSNGGHQRELHKDFPGVAGPRGVVDGRVERESGN